MKPDDRDRSFWTDMERARLAEQRPASRSELDVERLERALDAVDAFEGDENVNLRNIAAEIVREYAGRKGQEAHLGQGLADYNDEQERQRIRRLVSVVAWVVVFAFVLAAIWFVYQPHP